MGICAIRFKSASTSKTVMFPASLYWESKKRYLPNEPRGSVHRNSPRLFQARHAHSSTAEPSVNYSKKYWARKTAVPPLEISRIRAILLYRPSGRYCYGGRAGMIAQYVLPASVKYCRMQRESRPCKMKQPQQPTVPPPGGPVSDR